MELNKEKCKVKISFNILMQHKNYLIFFRNYSEAMSYNLSNKCIFKIILYSKFNFMNFIAGMLFI